MPSLPRSGRPTATSRVGYLCALEFVSRNGGSPSYPSDDPAGEVDEDQLAAWITERLA